MIQVETYLNSLSNTGVKPGLERIRALTEKLGGPHLKYPVIHVAGTNGKGSVSSMIANALHEAGYRTGLYTSPHLHRFNERIAIDGQPIDDASFAALLDTVAPLIEELQLKPTQFDILTAMAFLYFEQQNVDVAVIETGMGGTWDSTNIVQPVLSVITSVRLDHAEMLGDTIEAVASQKAGIIKPVVPVVLAPQMLPALEVLLTRAREVVAPVTCVTRAGSEDYAEALAAMGMSVERVEFQGIQWDLQGGHFAFWKTGEQERREFRVGMLGEHQLENAAVAVAAVDVLRRAGWHIPENALQRSLVRTRVPGRLEWFPGSPAILLDGAHNELGASQLAVALRRFAHDRPITFVCGLSSDKSPLDVLSPLLPLGQQVIFTKAKTSRLGNWEPEVLVELTRQIPGVPPAIATVPALAALNQAKQLTAPHGIVCVCGSLYLVAELRAVIVQDRSKADLVLDGPQ